MYNLKERDAIKRFLNEEIVNTSEAIGILGFTRQYLNHLVKIGEFEPVKEMPRDRLFIKEDILNFQKYRRGINTHGKLVYGSTILFFILFVIVFIDKDYSN